MPLERAGAGAKLDNLFKRMADGELLAVLLTPAPPFDGARLRGPYDNTDKSLLPAYTRMVKLMRGVVEWDLLRPGQPLCIQTLDNGVSPVLPLEIADAAAQLELLLASMSNHGVMAVLVTPAPSHESARLNGPYNTREEEYERADYERMAALMQFP